MLQENDAAALARATGTSMPPAALVSGSQGEGQHEERRGPVPLSMMSQQQKGTPTAPLVSQSQEVSSELAELDGMTTLALHEGGDGTDGSGQLGLDAETIRPLQSSTAEAATPKKRRGRPRKEKGTRGRGRPRKNVAPPKIVARGPPPLSPMAKPPRPGQRKRGRPRKDTKVDKASEDEQGGPLPPLPTAEPSQPGGPGRGRPRKGTEEDDQVGPLSPLPTAEPAQTGGLQRGHPRKGTEDGNAPKATQTRSRPDRSVTTSNFRGSIHVGAHDRSRSTGLRTGRVSDAGSKYNLQYRTFQRARLAALATNKEAEQFLANDVDCVYRGPVFGGKSHGRGTLVWDDGAVYEGHFEDGYRQGIGKLTYSGGIVFEGRFYRGERVKGKLTFPAGHVFEGDFEFEGDADESRASIKGLLTFASGDSWLDFEGDILGLEDRENDLCPRRGIMRLKNGVSCDGDWVAGEFRRGTLRWREFTERYPLAFCEYSSCPFNNDWKEGQYYGYFKDGKFHGTGTINWREDTSGLSWCRGNFKEGRLHGSCHWVKQSFFVCKHEKGSGQIVFKGTAVDGWIWPHVPSGGSRYYGKVWLWPSPPLTGLRFELNSKVSVNIGGDVWETAHVKGFVAGEGDEATGYRVLLESDCHTVLEITVDNDDSIRKVVTDFEVGMESHPDFGCFRLYYSGPVADGKPRGIGVLTVKYSKCCSNQYAYELAQRPVGLGPIPLSYVWERECEVEFGLNFQVRGASREYHLHFPEDNVTGFSFFADPLRQLVWRTRSIYSKSDKKDWHSLFGLIGSVLWNELQNEVATLGELFAEETMMPVLWNELQNKVATLGELSAEETVMPLRDVMFSNSDDDEGDNDHEEKSEEIEAKCDDESKEMYSNLLDDDEEDDGDNDHEESSEDEDDSDDGEGDDEDGRDQDDNWEDDSMNYDFHGDY